MTATAIEDRVTAGTQPGNGEGSGEVLASARTLIVSRPGSARDGLAELVDRLGALEVILVGDGAEALLELQRAGTDILLCDQRLADGSNAGEMHKEALNQGYVTPHTLFVVISDSRSARAVMSIAEFEPDACLIKPFVPTEVQHRLGQAWRRKRHLEGLHDALQAVDLPAIAQALQRLGRNHPELVNTGHRIASACLLESNELDAAETLAREALRSGQPAWALHRLAQVRMRQDRPDEAGKLLQRAVKTNPLHLGSLDMLADVRESQGRHDDALACLDQLSGQVEPTARQMRRTGRLSHRTGDLQRAERELRWAALHTPSDAPESIEDQADLVSVLHAQGRARTAEAVHQTQAKQLDGQPEAELLDALFALQRAAHRHDRRAVEAAGAQLLALIELTIDTLSLPLALRAVDAGREAGLRRQGFAMAGAISRSGRASRSELDQLRRLLSRLSDLPARE